MESKALGKGLSALIPDKAELGTRDKQILDGEVHLIDIEKIRRNSLQPRTDYNEIKLNELILSIKENGILQPILLREIEGGFEVVAGERRLLAAKAAAMKKIPAIIKNVSNEKAFVLALIENIQREDLNAIEEALAFKRLIQEFGMTHEAIAKSVGKDGSTITNAVRLLKLPEEIQKSVYRGELSMGHARALLGILDVAQQREAFLYILEKGMSVREVENFVRTKKPEAVKRRELKIQQRHHDLTFIEEDLQKALGTRVRIQPQKKRGKIVIEYYSADDLERLLKLITPA